MAPLFRLGGLRFGIVWLLVCAVPAAVSSFSAKRKGGFGSVGGKKPGKSPAWPTLESKAQTLLTRHNNNVDAASADYFNDRMKENGALNGSDLVFGGSSNEGGKTDEYVERRMDLIAKVCRKGAILVGCGDGAIIKYLNANNQKEVYLGIDISPKMIALTKQQHRDLSFEVALLPKTFDTDMRFDTVVFNGSLQFFQDTAAVLHAAYDLLAPGGRIVLAHVNGAAFVQQECRTNPLVAVQTMPTEDRLRQIAPSSARVMTKADLFPDDSARLLSLNDVPDRSFYLMALEKPPDELL